MIDDRILQQARTERSRAVAPPKPTRESLRQLRKQREDFLSDPLETDTSSVREVIARSWRRSLACKVDPIALRSELRKARIDGPFLRVAMPVVERLENVARDTGATVVLADPSGTIAMMRGDRDVLNWAGSRFALDGAYMTEEVTGTNSDGTALEEGTSVQVWGPEHYSEELQDAFRTSVPIRDPLRRRIAGILTLMVPEKVALVTDPASLSLIVEGAAAEITRSAAVRLAPQEQTLLEAYMRESRVRGAEAVLAIDDRTTIASTRAQQILTPEDYAILSGYAREAESGRLPFDQFVALAGGNRLIRVTAKPVHVEGDVVGAVLRLRETKRSRAPRLSRLPSRHQTRPRSRSWSEAARSSRHSAQRLRSCLAMARQYVSPASAVRAVRRSPGRWLRGWAIDVPYMRSTVPPTTARLPPLPSGLHSSGRRLTAARLCSCTWMNSRTRSAGRSSTCWPIGLRTASSSQRRTTSRTLPSRP